MAIASTTTVVIGRSDLTLKLQVGPWTPISSPETWLTIRSGVCYAPPQWCLLCNTTTPFLRVKRGSRSSATFILSTSKDDPIFVDVAYTDEVIKGQDYEGIEPKTLDLFIYSGIQHNTLDLKHHVTTRAPIWTNFSQSGILVAGGSLIRLDLNRNPQIQGDLQLKEKLVGMNGP